MGLDGGILGDIGIMGLYSQRYIELPSYLEPLLSLYSFLASIQRKRCDQ